MTPRRWREHASYVVSAHVIPVTAVAALAATAFGMRFPQRDGRPGDTSAQGLLFAALGAATLLLCRRSPYVALAGATMVFLGYGLVAGNFNPALQLPIMVCVYYLVLERPVRWSVLVVSVLVVLIWIIAIQTTSGAWIGPNRLGTVAYIMLAAAIGAVSRTRRAYLGAVEARARLAERMREDEATRRVAAERVRIAQDLHDITAHHLSLMHMQVAVALRLLPDRAGEAADILRRLQLTAKEALAETKAAVGVLRSDDHDSVMAPTPGIDDVRSLIDGHRCAGMEVELETEGDPVGLPDAIGLTAYRIVQEALTNAARHAADGTVRVKLTYGFHTLTIAVSNPAQLKPAKPPGPQFGLTGMQERARAVGGSVSADRRGRSFETVARLPLTSSDPDLSMLYRSTETHR